MIDLKKLAAKYREFILYGIIGGFSASIDFIVYTLILLAWPQVNVIVANAIGVVCGIATSFVLNRQYNFKVKDRTVRRFMIFFTVGIVGLIISSVMIYYTVDCLGWNKLLAKLMTIFIVSLIQFLLNKTITFKQIHNAS